MTFEKVENNLEKDFHVSWYIIIYKFGLGLIELSFGLGIILFGQQVLHLYHRLASHELSEDPHDLLVNMSSRFVPGLFTHDMFLVIYLMLLGSVKIAGSIGLIYKQNWGVDLLVIMTIILLPFQIVSLFIHPSIFDFIYIVAGLFIAFYLIEFKPKAWVSRMLLQWNNLKNKSS